MTIISRLSLIISREATRRMIASSLGPILPYVTQIVLAVMTGDTAIGVDLESQVSAAAAIVDGEKIFGVAFERRFRQDLAPGSGQQAVDVGPAVDGTGIQTALFRIVSLEVAGVDHNAMDDAGQDGRRGGETGAGVPLR